MGAPKANGDLRRCQRRTALTRQHLRDRIPPRFGASAPRAQQRDGSAESTVIEEENAPEHQAPLDKSGAACCRANGGEEGASGRVRRRGGSSVQVGPALAGSRCTEAPHCQEHGGPEQAPPACRRGRREATVELIRAPSARPRTSRSTTPSVGSGSRSQHTSPSSCPYPSSVRDDPGPRTRHLLRRGPDGVRCCPSLWN